MTLLIFAIIVVILVYLGTAFVDAVAGLVILYTSGASRAVLQATSAFKVAIILIAILVICNRAGWV